jgi:hypothetical protein
MVCHARGSTFDIEAWTKQIENQNFAWAATVAIGLAKVDGAVRRLPDDFDVVKEKAAGGTRPLPTTVYNENRFDADGAVFFDVVRSPPNNACYRCHSTLAVGDGVAPRWTHDEDVHLTAGFQCVDCHPNGLAHDTVRGFEREVHPQQKHIANLSCRGCHLGPNAEGSANQFTGGRMGAPYPQHRGLPTIHLERLSCTACHAGPLPGRSTGLVQTARNHFLGKMDHRKVHQQPEIVESVLMPDTSGVLFPHRVVWPSYWADWREGKPVPLNPNDMGTALRPVLRVSTDFAEQIAPVRLSPAQKAQVLGDQRAKTPTTELTESERSRLENFAQAEKLRLFRDRITSGLSRLKESRGVAEPVFVAGEKIYRLDAEGKLNVVDNLHAQPYAWPIGHDVRPARWALGANGCTDCHARDAPFLNAGVVAQAPVPDSDLRTRPMNDFAQLDSKLWSFWSESFRARTTFKWVLSASVACLSGVVLVSGTARLAARFSDRQNHS